MDENVIRVKKELKEEWVEELIRRDIQLRSMWMVVELRMNEFEKLRRTEIQDLKDSNQELRFLVGFLIFFVVFLIFLIVFLLDHDYYCIKIIYTAE